MSFLAGKSMSHSAKVYDEQGNLLWVVLITSMNVTIDRYGHDVSIEGKVLPLAVGVSKTVPLISNERIDASEAPCEHRWIPYQGLVESYTFCELCNKRRSESTDPKFANTYAQTSWRKQ